jgi:RNA polymerase sigma factor (sigma-70 family)
MVYRSYYPSRREHVTMDEDTWLAERFEMHRGRMKAVASRMLGSSSEADDAVQEAWLRFNRSDPSSIENLGAWLTTVVSRICLNTLQARRSRPVAPLEPDLLEPPGDADTESDPEQEAVLADSVGLALLVVLDTLTPAERVALVLHDMFGVPFDDIGPIVGRNASATRQLASRARRRVQSQAAPDESDRLRRATLVEAFLAAARKGDFEGLLAVLDPHVILRNDETAVALGAPAEIGGAEDAARFLQVARGARPALVDGEPAAVWMPGGQLRVVIRFTIRGDRIIAVDAVANEEDLSQFDLIVADRPSAS